ncbi:L,D-transpeptidase family protein [Microlunatus ginsengisoli]|uniref:L,D-TPase catalytic domain-containing protein n=1 Tax=Microlunatus ginsengisoli TaxID=363863 RepID=A0ABP7ANZ6_9ACTN
MPLARLLARCSLALAVSAGLVASAGVPAAASTTLPRTSATWRACDRTLDYVRTSIAAGQRTVTIVNQTSKTHARVSFYVRMVGHCKLKRMFLTKTARLGYGGTVAGTQRRQGTGTTPLGTYTMTETFGNGAAPNTSMPYHRVVSGDYWVQDRTSAYYNTLRNKAAGGFRWSLPSSSKDSSEKLSSYTKQYRYAVVINFNRAPDTMVVGRGSGIFLHVKGSGATGGCVGVTKGQMKTVMAYLRPGDRITIAR